MGFPWARYYDLAHGNPISHTHIERDWGVVRRGEVPPFGARADGPHLMSDAANEWGWGVSGGTPERVKGSALARAKRSLV